MVTVSVIMPVFNGEKYLPAAIESILTQTFRDFEFVALDDGSKDGSLRILQEFQKTDPRMRVISRENRGMVKTVNELFENARGEFVAINAQDDISLPDRLALQAAYLRENPGVVCVGGSYEMIDEGGRYLRSFQQPETDQEIQRLNLVGSISLNAACATIRRESFFRVGGFDPDFYLAEDLDLWLRLGEIGQLANVHEPVLKYRRHSGSISGQNPVQQLAVARRACERAWQRRGIQGTFEVSGVSRPTSDQDSQFEFMLRYGWWAFNSRERRTAIIYGWRAIQARPFRSDGWRLFACALLKPFEPQR